jgi:hypothetical protein
MAETTMIEGLSGTEIIADVLDQIKRKLMYSCDLRDSDSYGQGYSGTITINLKLYGMDATPVEIEVPIQPKVEPPVSTEQTIVTPIQVEEKVEIPQELDLEAVRERLKVSEPEPPEEPSAEEENRMPARLKRKYTRRTGVPTLEQTATGGAVNVDDQQAF